MRTLAFALVLALAGCARAAPTDQPAASTKAVQKPSVVITTKDGRRLAVNVELALEDSERARGLMYRRELGHDDGMLFAFPKDQVHTFWMRNTLIPLDMLFLDVDGVVLGIVREATPQTDTSRSVGKSGRYVLEVNGGWCAMNGVATGDRVDVGEAMAAAKAAGREVR
jgi:uncharacterized membrane protein (UPF0127 family)